MKRLNLIAFLLLIVTVVGCGGGDGAGTTGSSSAATINGSDIVGSWHLTTVAKNGITSDLSSYNITNIIDASTYTYSQPNITNLSFIACSESGTWSISGNNLVVTPTAITGDASPQGCNNQVGTSYSRPVSVSGSTLTTTDPTGVIMTWQKLTVGTSGGTTTGGGVSNNSFATASTALVSGNTTTGKISSSTDEDYYKITAASSGTISITMTPPGSKDYDLYLYDSSYTQVDVSALIGTETISYSASAGTYYIKVIGYQGAYDATDTYSLTATWPSGSGGSGGTTTGGGVSNNSFATASTALVSGNTATGIISSSTDIDYYKITAASSGTISIIMTPPGGKDYDLYLYDSGYTQVAKSALTGTETISYSASAGTYYIKVIGYQGAYDATNTYSLTATWPSGSGGSGGTTPTTLATGLIPVAIAVDSNSVYVSDFLVFGGAIKKVGLNGGAVTTLTTGVDNSTAIAVDQTSVYWVQNTYSTWDQGGAVKKAPLNGGTVTTLASGTGVPYTIALDSISVYFAEYYNGTIIKVGINGGTLTTIATGLLSPDSIVVDSTGVFWSDKTSIGKVGKDGSNQTVLASKALSSSGAIALDSSNVYWTEGANIRMISKNGGVVTDLVSALNNPRNIAIDSSNLYWFEDLSGGLSAIRRITLSGGTPTTVVSGLDGPSALAIDSTSIYWGERNSVGPIKKVSK